MNIQKQMRDTTSKWKGFDKVCKNLVSLFVFHLALVTSAFGKMWSASFPEKGSPFKFCQEVISTTHGPVATSACDFCNLVLTIEIKKLTALKDCVRRGIPRDG